MLPQHVMTVVEANGKYCQTELANQPARHSPKLEDIEMNLESSEEEEEEEEEEVTMIPAGAGRRDPIHSTIAEETLVRRQNTNNT